MDYNLDEVYPGLTAHVPDSEKSPTSVTWNVTTGKPVDLPPIPDRYMLDALELVRTLHIDHIARWLMERDKRWSEK